MACSFQFRLRNLRTESAWAVILVNDHSNLDLDVVGELNVLVSAGVRAMRYLYARAAGIQYRSIPLTALNEVPVAAAWPAAWGPLPAWWAVYSPYLNGQPWLDACTYEVLRLANMRTSIETAVPAVAAMPNHVLTWDDFTMSLDLDEAVLHELVANRRTLFLPQLDMTAFPRELILIMQQWNAQAGSVPGTLMRPLDWYKLLPDVNAPGMPVQLVHHREFNSSLPR